MLQGVQNIMCIKNEHYTYVNEQRVSYLCRVQAQTIKQN